MSARLFTRSSLIALSAMSCLASVGLGDDREAIQKRIQEVRKQAAALMNEGLKDKAEVLIREQKELQQMLEQIESLRPREGRGIPTPEQMEKFHRSMQKVHHLRVASEHLKQAEMHDMALDLMRRAEDIEQDLRNAKERMAEMMRPPKEPQRDQPQRDQPQRDQPERPRFQGPGQEARGQEARGQEARGLEARGLEARFNGMQVQIEQMRAENQQLRMMVEKMAEKMADGPRRPEPPNRPQAENDQPRNNDRMIEFAKRAIARADADKNGFLTPDEFKGTGGVSFQDVDTNKDGKIDVEEYTRYRIRL